MAINIQTTGSLKSHGVKICVYGQAGAGKTVLASTLPNPIILSAESGLLSIRDKDVPFIKIENFEQLGEAFQWCAESEEAQQFDSIALDSISEIAEVVLAYEKGVQKDGRAAYGEMNVQMQGLIRAFRDLPKNVYFSAKVEKTQDEMGKVMYNASMPGKSLTQGLPYFFDEVLALRVERDADGDVQRMLQCRDDGIWNAKDRSGKLEMWEQPDLGVIINKITGE